MIENENFHIFIAEDDLDDQEIFRDAIAKLNDDVKITMFDNGKALLNALPNSIHVPDVIFLDLYMPLMNGEDTLKVIRGNSIFDTIPIVIFSNEYNIDHISELFELGANRYLHKPDSFTTLITALERTISTIKKNNLGGTAIINYIE